MNKLIIANWKMNPSTLKEAIRIARASDKRGVVVVPPFVFTEEVGKVLKKAELGAQDVFWKDAGPYTGEVSWRELKRLGVKFVIVGHSERRALGENDSVINKKMKVALGHGLKVVLCVGEPWLIRKKGIKPAEAFVKDQLSKDLSGIKNLKSEIKNLTVAYEPIWAIGTGRNDTPVDSSEMARVIKASTGFMYKTGGARVLYGGSVRARNAKSFLTAPNIDGILVGGASLRAIEFKRIISLVKSGK